MSYEFKPLSGVEFTESVGENANMLVVDNGVVKQAPAASGGGATIFYVSDLNGDRLYKTADYETTATKEDVETAVASGPIYISIPQDDGNRFQLAVRVEVNYYYASVNIIAVLEDDGPIAFKVYSTSEYFDDGEEGWG